MKSTFVHGPLIGWRTVEHLFSYITIMWRYGQKLRLKLSDWKNTLSWLRNIFAIRKGWWLRSGSIKIWSLFFVSFILYYISFLRGQNCRKVLNYGQTERKREKIQTTNRIFISSLTKEPIPSDTLWKAITSVNKIIPASSIIEIDVLVLARCCGRIGGGESGHGIVILKQKRRNSWPLITGGRKLLLLGRASDKVSIQVCH